jgi:hypothetical protein
MSDEQKQRATISLPNLAPKYESAFAAILPAEHSCGFYLSNRQVSALETRNL